VPNQGLHKKGVEFIDLLCKARLEDGEADYAPPLCPWGWGEVGEVLDE
jgi:hypothetical protein